MRVDRAIRDSLRNPELEALDMSFVFKRPSSLSDIQATCVNACGAAIPQFDSIPVSKQ
jgi:hypothetical protein